MMKNKEEFLKQLIIRLSYSRYYNFHDTFNCEIYNNRDLIFVVDLINHQIGMRLNNPERNINHSSINDYYRLSNGEISILFKDEVILFSTDGFSKSGCYITFYLKYKYLLGKNNELDSNKVSIMLASLNRAIYENKDFLDPNNINLEYYFKYHSPKCDRRKRKVFSGHYHYSNLKGMVRKPRRNNMPINGWEDSDIKYSDNWRTYNEIDLYPYFKQVMR